MSDLPTRLWHRTSRPGCIDVTQGPAILARHTRRTATPPLSALLLARAATFADPTPLIVHATLPAATEVVTLAPKPAPPSPTVAQSTAAQPAPPVPPGRTWSTMPSRAPNVEPYAPSGARQQGHMRSPDTLRPPGDAARPRPADPAAPPPPSTETRPAQPRPATETRAAQSRPAIGTPAARIAPHEDVRHTSPPGPEPRLRSDEGTPAGAGQTERYSNGQGSARVVVRERPVVQERPATRERLVVREREPRRDAWGLGMPGMQRSWPTPGGGAAAPLARSGAPLTRTEAPLARVEAGVAGVNRAELAQVIASLLPREPAAARREDPLAREREARRAASVDIDRVVTTVQRRLEHHAAIERERRGLPR